MALISMSTTPVTTWATDISQLGPVYPFVGSEFLLVIAGVIFWLWFHAAQMRLEKREFEKDVAAARDPKVLKRVFEEEAAE